MKKAFRKTEGANEKVHELIDAFSYFNGENVLECPQAFSTISAEECSAKIQESNAVIEEWSKNVLQKKEEKIQNETENMQGSQDTDRKGVKAIRAMLPVAAEFVEGRNFDIKLMKIKELMKEDGEKEYKERMYQFQIILGREKFFADVSAKRLDRFSWVQEATWGRAYLDPQAEKTFKTYVHEILERDLGSVETEICYVQNGWKTLQNGSIVYVCDHGIVGEPTATISGGRDLKFNIIQNAVGTFENFQKFYAMESIFSNKKLAHTLMAFSSLAMLTTLFEKAGFPVKFLLALLGTTNTLKTSTALVFTRIFNAQEMQGPEVTFSSTMSGIETMVSKYADSVLLVDDFMPAENKKKQSEQNSKLELLCRLYGDRTPKKRMTDFAGKKVEYPVKGCCVITGELLTGVESSRTRILVLNLRKNDVNKEVLAYYQQNPAILPTYMYGFIQFVQKDAHGWIARIGEYVRRYRQCGTYSIARLNETQAILFAVIDVMSTYWKAAGFIEGDYAIEQEWKSDIQEIVAENDRQLRTRSQTDIILSALHEFIENHPDRVKSVEDMKKTDTGVIYENQNFCFVQAKELFLLVKSYCTKYDTEFYLQSADMLVEKLKEKEVLDTVVNEKGHTQASRKLKQGTGNNKRYLYIKKEKLADLMERMEDV